ncbi:MAG: sodium:alanine symporter family protein [Clostridia bacterium]|nr:sodium:alanine symporter family protein [Clostridia bacterium]
MKLLQGIYDLLLSPIMLVAVLLVGIVCTLWLGRYFVRHPLRITSDLLGKTKSGGRLSSLKALTVALAGTLGVGNIAGVAAAIAAGGAGAVFWMWLGALLSMLIKYAEVVLAVRYRRVSENGFIGGAMYYMRSPRTAAVFALLCLFASFALGNVMQAETVARSMEEAFSIPPVICGILLAILLYLVICRGFTRISQVTLYLVPLTAAIYVGICLFAIGKEITALPRVLAAIFRSAFVPPAALGGAGGLALARVIRTGISRGLITHEAGCGTAPMAHAEANTDSPVRQGFLGIFEVFADTMILCSLTAFVLLIHMDRFPTLEGMELVIAAFSVSLGGAAGPILALLICCFAAATMIGWSHYGTTCIAYLANNNPHLSAYKKLYAIAYSFLAILGSVTASNLMWLLSDYAVALMLLLHLPCLPAKLREVTEATRAYFAQSARSLENTLAPDADSAKSKDLREIP